MMTTPTPISFLKSALPARTSSAGPNRSSGGGVMPSGGHRSIQAAWRENGINVPVSPTSGSKKVEEAKSRERSPDAPQGRFSPPLWQQAQNSPSPTSDPFAKVSRSGDNGDISSPGTSRPSTAPTGGRTFNIHMNSTAASLPPYLAHLYFPSQTFPHFLLAIASKLFYAKMLDLGLKVRDATCLEKERRFVWLVCRQSMGASGTSTTSTTSLTSSSLNPVGPNGCTNEIGMMAFRVPDLSLGPHAVKEICQFLAYDQRFAHLQLSGNVLGDDGAARLSSLLQTNTNLTSLDIRGTGLGQHAFATLLESLKTHPTVTALDASSLKSEGRMFMGLQGCKALSRVLKHNTVLRKLHLSNVGLVAEGVSTVVRGLQLNRTLVSLDLSCNDLTQKSIAKFGEGFASLHTLQSLYLAENLIGTVGCVILCETLRKMENLKKLDLRKNQIGLRGFSILTDTVGEMISLQELFLDGNPLNESNRGGVIVSAAANALISAAVNDEFKHKDYVDSVIKRLHLTDKRVSPRLLLNSALRTLSLNQTAMSDRLLEDLCRVLATHKGIQSLHLVGNNLSDMGGFALSDLIRHSHSLNNIHMNENNLNDEGGTAIALALAHPNSHVNYLALRVNNVGKNTATAIIHALSHKRSLHVDFTGNKIPWILFSKVNELSAKNRRVFEASLSERYQVEWERLQARHEYRLQIEDSCLDSVQERSDLTETLAILEEGLADWKEKEQEETRALQAELHDWNHQLHEIHAVEYKVEQDLAQTIKEMEGRVMTLRKAIEKEQRFIQSAEKLIPQTLEEIAQANAEFENSVIDQKRDLRLYTTDRNMEYDSLLILKADLMKFIRDLENEIKPQNSPKKRGTSGSPTKSRPGSSTRSRPSGGAATSSSTTSRRNKSPSSPKSNKKSRPPSAQRTQPSPPNAAASSTSRPRSAARQTPSTTRPPSAVRTTSRPESAAPKKLAAAAAAAQPTEGTTDSNSASASASARSGGDRKARASTAPLKGRKKTTTAAKADLMQEAIKAPKDSSEEIAAALMGASIS